MSKPKSNLVVVTGLSGAGKSVAINALEDLGYYCIDNLPLKLFDEAIRMIASDATRSFALGVDSRDSDFAEGFLEKLAGIEDQVDVDVIFLTASDEAIADRYRSTRRKHPYLATGGELDAAIERERAQLQKIESAAHAMYDTSHFSPHQLARMLEQRYAGDRPKRNLYVTITSFGFKYGQYRPADSIFDVRFLSNPYFVPALRDKTGLSADVREYVFGDERASDLLDHLIRLHEYLLPQYLEEGKHYFRLGIGCTGGKHRSVCMAEALGLALAERNLEQVLVSVNHRDVSASNPLGRR